jgi:hypothetical protein
MKYVRKIIGIGIIAGISYLAGNYQMISQRINNFPENLEQRVIPPVFQLVCGGKTEPEDITKYIREMYSNNNDVRVQEFIQQLSPRAQSEFLQEGFSQLSYHEKISTLENMYTIIEDNP